MQKVVLLTTILAVTITLIECDKPSSSNVQETPNETSDTVANDFEFIDTKNEFAGSLNNRMDLYYPKSKFDPGSFDDLCKSVKKKMGIAGFYYLVVFDKKENAAFPNSPLTALYGLEEESQKHIIAVYTYNANNNYSKVTTFAPNMWNGKPSTYEIY